MLISCQTQFTSREAMCEYVAQLDQLSDVSCASPFIGGKGEAVHKLSHIDPKAYARSRNHLAGKVSQLSPYIRHGILSDQEVLTHINQTGSVEQNEKLIQQLMWRNFFHAVHLAQPKHIWQDYEPYKTGFSAQNYALQLPADIQQGATGVRIIDQMIETLLTTGYLHNHARLYLASYIVHWRRVRWQAGAHWFLQHLLDGDIASNNYSWQWVASTLVPNPMCLIWIMFGNLHRVF